MLTFSNTRIMFCSRSSTLLEGGYIRYSRFNFPQTISRKFSSKHNLLSCWGVSLRVKASKAGTEGAELLKNIYSTYEKTNGAHILTKIKILFAQGPRYLPYLKPCAARLFIFTYLRPPSILQCESNVFVTIITWCRWVVHEPYLTPHL